MNKILCELKNAAIIKLTTDTEYHPGCETCDYGSEYINLSNIETTNYNIHIEVNDMFDYAMSEDFWIKFFCQNANMFASFTEEQFIDFLKEEINKKYKNEIEYEIIINVEKK